MSDSIHMPFLARNLTVKASPDAQLVGLSGMVVGESGDARRGAGSILDGFAQMLRTATPKAVE